MKKDNIFPYKPKRNIVVFGQREAWYKGIKQCLLDVKIICDKDSNKNYKNIIKNADIVWIHTKMSHSFYNKINKTTKKLNKPIFYLRGLGGMESAMQIYNLEEKGEYTNYLFD